VMTAVTSRIKILGRMDVADKRRPQDGRVKTRTPGGREVELRLSTMPTAFGEKCVMRIFDPDIAVKNFSLLGFTPRESELWQQMIDHPNGIILVTGPTGSGKTTALYSTLKHLARPEVNVCTVEDPIEMIAPEFNQMQVQPTLDLTFAQGIRTLLRQDPDIIMVGEIRDLETAQMAVQAALTGHLVFSTLHTTGAAKTIDRVVDVFPPFQQQQVRMQLSMTLVAVLSQQLLLSTDNKSRVIAVETMIANSAIRNLIRENKIHQVANAIQSAGASGMQLMDNALAQLYRTGKISRETAITHSMDKNYISTLL